MKPQNIHSLVAGPIEINGRYIGFYGVDNPPADHLDSIANLIDIMDFVISMMIRLRDNSRTIKNMAVKDQLTNCKNRMALKWAYDNTYDKEKSIFVLMCDLKKVGMSLGYAYRNKSHEPFSNILREANRKMYMEKQGYYASKKAEEKHPEKAGN